MEKCFGRMIWKFQKPLELYSKLNHLSLLKWAPSATKKKLLVLVVDYNTPIDNVYCCWVVNMFTNVDVYQDQYLLYVKTRHCGGFFNSNVPLYLRVFVVGRRPYLSYLCLFAYIGVQHILCCVLALFFFVLCTMCCQFHWTAIFLLPLQHSLTCY